jgi:hypothetical protein
VGGAASKERCKGTVELAGGKAAFKMAAGETATVKVKVAGQSGARRP